MPTVAIYLTKDEYIEFYKREEYYRLKLKQKIQFGIEKGDDYFKPTEVSSAESKPEE